MSDPTFEPVDMQHLKDEGVLLAANERFFWPLGLSLVWYGVGKDGETYDGGLHIREWDYGDGHVERIELAADDPVGVDRRARFEAWVADRLDRMPEDERPPMSILDAVRSMDAEDVQLISIGIVKKPLHPWTRATVKEEDQG